MIAKIVKQWTTDRRVNPFSPGYFAIDFFDQLWMDQFNTTLEIRCHYRQSTSFRRHQRSWEVWENNFLKWLKFNRCTAVVCGAQGTQSMCKNAVTPRGCLAQRRRPSRRSRWCWGCTGCFNAGSTLLSWQWLCMAAESLKCPVAYRTFPAPKYI